MILDDIVLATKKRVLKEKENISLDEMISLAHKKQNKLKPFAFEHALKYVGVGFICEVKKASPSKGIIAEDFPYTDIALDYQNSGADCISVLTEPDFFKGDNQFLTEIKSKVNIPIIRKDFTIDEYQIYQAKVIGADAVLLICAILDTHVLRKYIRICDELGLSALVEAHDEAEVKSALDAGARIIGVNNRNLKNFTVDIQNSITLRKLVPDDIIFIAESGIKTADDIRTLEKANVNGVLIGETLMRAENKSKMLHTLRGTKIKICGLRRMEDILIVNQLKPNYIGFVFADSKRHVDDEKAQQMKAELSREIMAVGVFVNDTIEHICKLCHENIIDIIQLHGDETEEFISTLKQKTNKPIIKAIRVKNKDDITKSKSVKSDYILFDTFHEDTYGGTGKDFDLSFITSDMNPFFLAGGINNENVEDKMKAVNPYCIDVSSSVETNGCKDYDKVKNMIEKVRNYHGKQ